MRVDAKERIDIHSVVLEQASLYPRALPFNPERDITQSDWQEMKDWLKRYRSANLYRNINNYCDLAFDMYILFPERKGELELDSEVQRIMKERFNSDMGKRHESQAMHLLSQLKVFFPDSQRVAKHVDDNHQVFNRFIRSERRDLRQEPYSVAASASRYKILYPEEDLEQIFGNFDFKKFDKKLNSAADTKNVSITAYALLAAGCRLAFPKYFTGYKIDPAIWQDAGEELVRLRKTNWMIHRRSRPRGTHPLRDFASLTRNLAILAAEKITIDDDGIHLELPQGNLSGQLLKLPQTRRF